jgi:hypothetical protein
MSSKEIESEKPRLFVSHKQGDASIAKALADFLNDKSGYSLDIHFSSSPEFEGPRISRNIDAELRNALFRTDALILVYTTEDQDWAYCMWECGLATDPASPDTAIYVFQCGVDVPRPFHDTLRTDASKIDDLRKFVRTFLKDPSFFPTVTELSFRMRLMANAMTTPRSYMMF